MASAARAKYAGEKHEAEELIKRKDEWQKNLDELRSKLPKYAADQPVSAELLKTITKTAESHNLHLTRTEPEEEKQAGDVSELAITCTWDGELEALIHFLYDVQMQGAVLDIREITMAPGQASAGQLKGNFKVFCAFTRERAQGVVDQKKRRGKS